MKQKKLTKRQLDVMKILWDSDHALTASEITKSNSSLNINTVRSSIQVLLKNGYIKIGEVVYSGTVLSRSYFPCVSADEYIEEHFSGMNKNFSSVICNFIEKENDLKVLEQVESVLKKRREELKRNN